MKIKIGSKTWRFKDSYNDFTLIDIKKWMPILAEIERLNALFSETVARYEGLGALVDMGMSEQADQEANDIDSDLDDIRINLTESMMQFLEVCCTNKGIKYFLENTAGITYPILVDITQAIANQYGGFVDYFNSCKMVESFTHRSKKDWLSKKYKVQNMDKTTLMRDAIASVESQMAFQYKLEVSAGAWDNICKFVAIVARPTKQENEIDFSDKAFINAKKLTGLSPSDKAAFYQQQLEKSVNERCEAFENLPLPIAIGVLLMYEKKKQIAASDGKPSLMVMVQN